METEVYASSKSPSKFLLVRKGTDVMRLPDRVREEFGGGPVWKTLNLASSDHRVALDAGKAIAGIEATGYHIAEVAMLFEEHARQ